MRFYLIFRNFQYASSPRNIIKKVGINEARYIFTSKFIDKALKNFVNIWNKTPWTIPIETALEIDLFLLKSKILGIAIKIKPIM